MKSAIKWILIGMFLAGVIAVRGCTAMMWGFQTPPPSNIEMLKCFTWDGWCYES